jgi:hypothetical protein
MKPLTHHVHATASSPETPDPRPGNYYVSALDGPAHHLLLGPFSRHADALDRVEPVRHYVTEHGGPRAHFMAYGTVRMADSVTTPGTANQYLPDLLAA